MFAIKFIHTTIRGHSCKRGIQQHSEIKKENQKQQQS